MTDTFTQRGKIQRWLFGMALLLLLTGCATDQTTIPVNVTIAEPRPTDEPAPAPFAQAAPPKLAAPSAAIPTLIEMATPLPSPQPETTAAKPKPLKTPEPSHATETPASDKPELIAKTAYGTASYYVPNKMIEKAPSIVHLWIDPTMPVKVLQEKLAKQLKLDIEHIKVRMEKIAPTNATMAGDVQGLTNVRVGDRMVAQLSGNDFEFSPAEPTPGELDGSTWKWHWQVTPQHATKSQPLLLTIKAWIDEAPRKTSMPSIDEPVIVEAVESWSGRVDRWTEFLKAIEGLYAALAAVAAILFGLGVKFKDQLRRFLRIGGKPN